MAGGRSKWAILTPAGHSPVYEPLVDRTTGIWTKAEPLSDARTKALDENVGPPGKVKHRSDCLRSLQVKGDGRAAPRQQIVWSTAECLPAGSLDTNHIGTEVREDHARMRPRSDPTDLNHTDPLQRTTAGRRIPSILRHAPDTTWLGTPVPTARRGGGGPPSARRSCSRGAVKLPRCAGLSGTTTARSTLSLSGMGSGSLGGQRCSYAADGSPSRGGEWIRDLDRVRRIWADCQGGRYEVGVQPGHPLGFYSHAYAGEVALCRVLADPTGELTDLRTRAREYPAALGDALVEGLWEADFAVQLAHYGTAGTDPTYAAGCLFRGIGVACHALHGRARQWLINEKGMVASAAMLAVAPPSFAERAHSLLAGVGGSQQRIAETAAKAEALIAEVRAAIAQPAS
ncbi:hypothetical protein GCM10010199_72810 [Dactylosporangium roseum]